MDFVTLCVILALSSSSLSLAVWRFLYTRIRDQDMDRLFGDLNGVSSEPLNAEGAKERALLAYCLDLLPLGSRGVEANTWTPFDHRGDLTYTTPDGTRRQVRVYVPRNPFKES